MSDLTDQIQRDHQRANAGYCTCKTRLRNGSMIDHIAQVVEAAVREEIAPVTNKKFERPVDGKCPDCGELVAAELSLTGPTQYVCDKCGWGKD